MLVLFTRLYRDVQSTEHQIILSHLRFNCGVVVVVEDTNFPCEIVHVVPDISKDCGTPKMKEL